MAQAATARAARKRPEIVITKSSQATVDETATQIWSDLFTPVAGDAEKNAAAYKSASDKLQKLFEALRARRDDSKPVQRERLDTEDVLAEAVGKPVSELQAAYVQLQVGKTKGGEIMYDRVSLPKVRQYSEIEDHPMHEAAMAFLAENKLRFIEREGKSKGKKVSVLEEVA